MNPETVFKTWLPASMQGMEQMQQMQQAFWSQLANIATSSGGGVQIYCGASCIGDLRKGGRSFAEASASRRVGSMASAIFEF